MQKDKLALFGYGKTTKAIASYLGGGCIFFDDNTTTTTTDSNNNIIYPSTEFESSNFEIEVPTPSIPPNHPLIKKANNLFSEYDLFLAPNSPLALPNPPFSIWISGTNGKTTTTQMLTHLLKSKGAVSGGNIGTPLANLNPKAPIWVLETSSFTLHHTKYAKPNIYLLLPITPDHISWHGSTKEYIKDKLRPLELMEEGELALIPKGLPLPKSDAWIVEYENIEDIKEFFNIEPSKIDFQGAFLLDAMLSLAVTKALFDEVDYNLINSFKLDAHRQEKIIDRFNRVWINDSKATNIDATLKAVEIFKDKEILLILGGDDKGVDLNDFFNELKNYNLKIFAIGSNASKIKRLSEKNSIECYKANILEEALKKIDKLHTQDTIALLSPAASSLDQFKSYAHRGDSFKNFIKNL
ncbi:MAG: UDP-N-acetylmuramoyl-L-alanine--D-glutamate ligase [Epsilonproteobacteria bacterium]|nr:UDP-N-acetylmuramoyl-L-alanine--D-glutamate ligase [Campylobacterota bacterium]